MKKKFLFIFLAIVNILCLCFYSVGCGGDNSREGGGKHTHTAKFFQIDDEAHWKICDTCGKKFSEGNHNYNAENGCEICGYSTVYTKGLSYRFIDETNTYEVYGRGDVQASDIVIPAYYKGKAVSQILDRAFYNLRWLKSVVIPNTVVSIGFDTFSRCSELTNIVIPNSVTSIGYDVLEGTAYYDNPSNWDEDGILYVGNHLIQVDKERISETYTVKSGIKTIAGQAFSACPHLTNIIIPDSVVSIGYAAFENCSELESVTIGSGVESIGGRAFSGCIGLTSIEISNSVTSIGYEAFVDTAYYNDITNWENGTVLYVGNHLIKAKDTMSGAYTVRNGTKTIAAYAFHDCEELTSITIPDSVTSIGYYAFFGCRSLTGELIIPDSVTFIGEGTFWDCGCLTSIVIPDGVTSIGRETFRDCKELTNVELSENLTYIGKEAFKGCEKLSSIRLPERLISIDFGAFYGCSMISSFHIPDDVIAIGSDAFLGTAYYNDESNWEDGRVLYIGKYLIKAKSTLSDAYTIRAGTKLIARYAFDYCEKLTQIYIPSSVKYIGFDWKYRYLKSIYFDGTKEAWEAALDEFLILNDVKPDLDKILHCKDDGEAVEGGN